MNISVLVSIFNMIKMLQTMMLTIMSHLEGMPKWSLKFPVPDFNKLGSERECL